MSVNAPYFEILDGDQKGTQFRLLGDVITIGRSADCDIPLEQVRGVSRRHAQIMMIDGRVRLRDLGSQNGTLVEGKRVRDAILANGTTIRIGQCSLRLHIPEEAVAAAPVPARPGRPAKSSSRSVAATAAGELAQGASAPIAEGQGPGAEMMIQAAGERSAGFLGMALLLVALIVGGLYVVEILLQMQAFSRNQQEILNKGQVRLVPIRVSFVGFAVSGLTQAGGDIVSVKEYEGWLRPELQRVNKDNAGRGLPALRFLVVEGLARGDASVDLKKRDGQIFKRIEVIVRGLAETHWDTLVAKNAAQERIDALLRDADRLKQDEQLYRALMLYQEAEMVSRRVLNDEKQALTIQDKYRPIRLQLKEQLEMLFRDAMIQAFPPRNTPGRRSWTGAFQTLANGKRLLDEDETNLEWQIFDYWQSEIRKLAKR